MELETFISKSLIQIISGVQNAQKEVAKDGAIINPKGVKNAAASKTLVNLGTGELVVNVCFDVAVTVDENSQTSGGIGVVAGIIALGSQGQSQTTNNSVSRITFSVPVVLPSHISNTNCNDDTNA